MEQAGPPFLEPQAAHPASRLLAAFFRSFALGSLSPALSALCVLSGLDFSFAHEQKTLWH